MSDSPTNSTDSTSTSPSTEGTNQHPQPEPAQVELTANTESITDLFARDPESWNDADLDRMVEHLRKQRVKLDAVDTTTKGAKKTAPKIATEDLKGKSGADLLGVLGITDL